MKFNKKLAIICFSLVGIGLLFVANENDDTSIGPSGVVGTGIGVHSGEMKTINLESVKKQNITNIYLHSNVLDKYSENEVQKFIKECNDKKIKVHLWITVFRYDGQFNKPTKAIVKERLDLIRKCSNISNISGINLDYIRYDGKNPSIVDENIITDFVKESNNIVKDNGLELSVCLMPEKEQAIRSYGQKCERIK
jgi:hypothetical protein